MRAFTTLRGIAAPMPAVNVDTDAIIPKQFLKTIKRTGLGTFLFNDLRYGNDGQETTDFVLNREPFRKAEILVVGANFGCGSSREHAPWALMDFGIRCVIGPSFADIFFNNCFKNGVLPVVLPQEQIDQLMALADRGQPLTIDLEHQTVSAYPDNVSFSFEVDAFRRECLLNGYDDIALTEKKTDLITSYETQQKTDRAWL